MTLSSPEATQDPSGGRLLDAVRFRAEAAGAINPKAAQVRVLKRQAPFYPYYIQRVENPDGTAFFKSSRDAGKAEVAVLVGEDGKPRFVQVLSATKESFGLNAALAALEWEFAPVEADGKPAKFQVVIPFSFKPQDNPPPPPADAGTPPADIPMIRLPAG